MPRYTVPLTTWANIAVDVDVPDGVTDPQVIAELALDQIRVSLCNHCSGHSNDSLEIGDDFEPVYVDGIPCVTPAA